MIRPYSAAILAAVLTMLGACAPKAEPPPPAPAPLTIGPEGAGGIKTALPFTQEAIAGAMAGLEVIPAAAAIEGSRFPTYAVKDATGEVVFTALPRADGSGLMAVHTKSPKVSGPAGEKSWEASFGDIPPADAAYCADELYDGQPGFACATAPDARFWRVYLLLISDSAPEAATFATAEPSARAGSPLVEMRWVAP